MPTAPQALSPPPPATGMPARRPSAAAASRVSATGNLGAFDQARHLPLVETAGREHRARPLPARNVEPQRSRGIRRLADEFAGQLKRSQSFGSSTRAMRREMLRLVLGDPDELGRREARHRQIAGDGAALRLAPLELAACRRLRVRRSTGSPDE